jgi:hypothetical protein
MSLSAKPRLVILHMTASQLIQSVASLSKAKAVPNLAERKFWKTGMVN